MRHMLMVALVAACRNSGPDPSPLGTLDAKELGSWQADCSTPLVAERVCGPAVTDQCDEKFHTLMPHKNVFREDAPGASARLKRTCGSEGWAIWTDGLDRIVGFCVARAPGVGNSVRMKQFITRHRGETIAKKIDDFSAGRNRDDSEQRWHDWSDVDMIPRPPEMGEQACIEFQLK